MELTKSQKRNIRELAGLAHERELGQELGKLEEQFAHWRRGGIDAHALSEVIHEFHNGPARELYSLYSGDMLELVVAGALARGVLKPAEIPDDTLPILRRYNKGR
jgi:hypothetical protein